MQSVTRKFLVNQTPDLTGKKHWAQRRFYIFRKNGVVVRIQSKGNEFELERKIRKTDLIRESEKIAITKEEFESVSKIAVDYVIRDSYLMSQTPHVSLRIYHGQFEGLTRAEIDFQSVKEANQFVPLKWMAKEITSTPLACDETLLELSEKDFQALL
ncbi:MAG: hypothetical protein Q7S76_01220 [bacterium]|nr:hypothetical protein [bacterium]